MYMLPYTDESNSVKLCGIVWEGLKNKRSAFPWLVQISAVSITLLYMLYISYSTTRRRRDMHVMAR